MDYLPDSIYFKVIYQLRELRISATKAIEAIQEGNSLETLHQIEEIEKDCEILKKWINS